jgi:hypothetical protein
MPLIAFFASFFTNISIWFWTILITAVPFITKYVLVALGLGAVTYIGVDYAMDVGLDLLINRYDEVPPELADILVVMGIPDAIATISAAATSSVALKAVGGFTKWRANRPTVFTA